MSHPLLVQLAWQASLLVPSLFSWWLLGPVAAKSFLAGGLVFVAAHTYFTLYAFPLRNRDLADRNRAYHALKSFMRGESGKFVLTLVLFALVFLLLKPRNDVFIFCGYVFMVGFQFWLNPKLVALASSSK